MKKIFLFALILMSVVNPVWSLNGTATYEYEARRQSINSERYRDRFSQGRQSPQDQQAQARRDADLAARGRVLDDLQRKVQTLQQQENRSRAEVLYYIFKILETQAVNGSTPPVVREQFHSISISPENIEYMLNKLSQTDPEDWENRAQLSTDLLNPWSGVSGTERAKAFADDQGLLRGPIFAENSVALKNLAKHDPLAAYELARAANSLQAYFQAQPYLLKGEKNLAVMSGAAAMIRASAVSADPRQMNIAKSLVAFFTGETPSLRMTVVEENGVVKFAPGNTFVQVVRSESASQKIAQAVYNELAQNLSWMSTEGNSEAVNREWGKAYAADASILQFLRASAQDSNSWIAHAKQTYRLSDAPNLTFLSPDVQKAFSETARMRSSLLPQGDTARTGAFSAFKIADDLIKVGETSAGREWLRYGRMMADVGLGFVPGVGMMLDTYSLVTGWNLITSERLSVNERLFSAASMVTLGYGGRIYNSAKALKGLKTAAEGGHFLPVLNRAIHQFERLSGDALNIYLRKTRGYEEDAWRIGGAAVKFKLPEKADGVFARVFKEANEPSGSWLVEKKLIAGKSAHEIEQMLRLSYTPKYVVDVNVPAGTEVIRGALNHRAFQRPNEQTFEIFRGRRIETKPAQVRQYFVDKYDENFFIRESIKELK